MITGDALEVLRRIQIQGADMIQVLTREHAESAALITKVKKLAHNMETLRNMVPDDLYAAYQNFFEVLGGFCIQCVQVEFLLQNKEMMLSSLQLFQECMEELIQRYQEREEELKIDEKLCREGPLVSVIMSCYNHEMFVADAIESVLNQSYKNIEFLVADDGSKDNSALIMQKYSGCFAKEFYFEDNIGSRFQFLKQQAKGKYIALMNSDDVWEKDKLALQVTYMEEHEECGACFTWCRYTDENLREFDNNVFIQKNRKSSEWMRFFWQKGNCLCNPSSLIRRDLSLKSPKYGSACWQLPDLFKWIDLVQITEMHVIPKVLIKMRRYEINGRQNTSFISEKNLKRHMAEEGHNWFWVIRDMENHFFKETFADIMVNPHAFTEQEIKCEKYFLMLNHHNSFIQNGALCYFSEIYNDAKQCMEDTYHYTLKDFKEDMLYKGLAASGN